MKYIYKQPFIMSGLVLGLAALGNLLQSYGAWIRLVCGAIAIILFISLTFKVVLRFGDLTKEMQQAVVASVFPTYSMSIILLSTYLKPLFGISLEVAEIVWWLGVILDIILIIYFTFKFALKMNMSLVFPSWGVVYSGLVVASVTAAPFGNQVWGQYFFWFGIIGGLLVMPFMLYRVFVRKDLPIPTRPGIAILCAPISLCVAGYVNSFPEPNLTLLVAILIIAQALYLLVLFQLPSLMRVKFIPSFSAFTFPLVISALSFKLALPVLGWSSEITNMIVLGETIIATLAVIYVFFGYLGFIFTNESSAI